MKPPLRTPSNVPFQRSGVGSQTSKLICESLVGEEKAITRQKGCETLNMVAGPSGLGGSAMTRSGGGSIAVADSIVAFGISSDVRPPQDCCAAAPHGTSKTPASNNRLRHEARRMFMGIPRKRNLTFASGV